MPVIRIALAILMLAAPTVLAQVNFPDGTSQSTGTLTNVTVVQAQGTATANGTDLIAAMGAISGSNPSPKVIQLAAGTYDLGGSTLTLKPYVTLRGMGKGATTITGSGSVLVTGDDQCVIRDLLISGTTGGSTLLSVANVDTVECFRVGFLLETATGTSTCLSIASGAEVDVTSCEFGGDANNPSGVRRGINVHGGGSQAFAEYCLFDFIEESQNGGLTGVRLVGGGEAELIGCNLLMERDTTQASGGDVIGVEIASGSRLIATNSTIAAEVGTSGGSTTSISVSNAGSLTAFSTLVQGDVPTFEFFNSNVDQVTLSQCSQNYADL